MTIQIEVAELGPEFEAFVAKLAQNGGEAILMRDGKAVGKLSVQSAPESDDASGKNLVLYNGRWMIPAAAERERSIEHLRGKIKILGDIESPIDDGPLAGSVIDEGDIISPIDAEWEAAK
jgi:hypothetical protein